MDRMTNRSRLGTDDWGDAENAPEIIKTLLPLTGQDDLQKLAASARAS
jgi:hypothetical protein